MLDITSSFTNIGKNAPIATKSAMSKLSFSSLRPLEKDVVQIGGDRKTFRDIGKISENDIVPVKQNAKNTFYRYKDSKLIKDFDTIMQSIDKSKGISTSPYVGGVLLDAKDDVPLGTSGVGNCAVICLYNSKQNRHAIYHAAPIKTNAAVKIMKKDIERIMPDGFDRAIMIPGANPETATTMKNLFDAAKHINKNAIIEFKHTDKDGLVEFVSYKGNVYCTTLTGQKPLFEVQDCCY